MHMSISYSRVVLAALLCALFAVPVFAHAQTIGELQAQVNALLNRLTQLQTELTTVTPTTPTTPTTSYPTPIPPTTPTTPATPTVTTGSVLAGGLSLNRDIGRDDSGDDVSRLQAFLARDVAIYPEGRVTGFYGGLTEAAVKRFQIACGIISTGDYNTTGLGRVGPRTRTTLLNGCGSAPTVGSIGGTINVSPTRGAPPLSVNVIATVNTYKSCDYGSYSVDFGDGSAPFALIVPGGRCAELQQTIPHVYATPGEYTISLSAGGHKATSKVTVSGTASTGTTGTVTGGTGTFTTGFSACVSSGGVVTTTTPRTCSIGGVTYTEVAGTLSDYVGALPTTGTVPFDVTFTTRINANASCAAREYTIDFGDGQRAALLAQVNSCAPVSATITHRYTTAGTYTVRLYDVPLASIANATSVANVSVSAYASTSATDPQLTLTAAYEGIARQVRAVFTLANTCTPYTLGWGDGSTLASRSAGTSGCSNSTDQVALTHTYPSSSSSSTYIITLTYGNAPATVRTATLTISGN